MGYVYFMWCSGELRYGQFGVSGHCVLTNKRQTKLDFF